MSTLEGLLAAAALVGRVCEQHGWQYCFIGGIAVQRWGKPRFTVDVDITLLTGYRREESFVDALLKSLLLIQIPDSD